MKTNTLIVLCLLFTTSCIFNGVDGRRSRGSARGSGSSPRGGGRGRAPKPSTGTGMSSSTGAKVGGNVKNGPMSAPNAAPSYPSSGGLSGFGPNGKNPAAGNVGSGVGTGGTGVHSYPSSNGLSGVGGGNPSYPAGNGLSGSSPVKGPPPSYNQAIGSGNSYAVPGSINNPLNGAPMSYGNTFAGRNMYAGSSTAFFRSYGGGNSAFFSNSKLGLILSGLMVYNMLHSGRRENHYHYYNRPDDKEPQIDPEIEALLKELSHCTLTLTSTTETESLTIPCEIATSFTSNENRTTEDFYNRTDNSLNCTISVFTKNETQITTHIPCVLLSSMAPEEEIRQSENCTEIGNCVNGTNLEVFEERTTVFESKISLNSDGSSSFSSSSPIPVSMDSSDHEQLSSSTSIPQIIAEDSPE